MMRSSSTSTASRCSSRVGPSYQPVIRRAYRYVVAELGRHRNRRQRHEVHLGGEDRYSSTRRSKDRLIEIDEVDLLMASTTWRMPSSEAMKVCRRVWVKMPWRGIDQHGWQNRPS